MTVSVFAHPQCTAEKAASTASVATSNAGRCDCWIMHQPTGTGTNVRLSYLSIYNTI